MRHYLLFWSVALMLASEVSHAKVGHAEINKPLVMPGGDERDIVDFYPFQQSWEDRQKEISPDSHVTLTVTPEGDQPRVVILYNQKQVEIERRVLQDKPVSFQIKRSESYAFVRVLPVGGRYDNVAGEKFARSITRVDGAVSKLLPYTVSLKEAPAGHLEGFQIASGNGIAPPNSLTSSSATSMTPPPSKEGLEKAVGPRLALIVTNANYGASFGNLSNPINDGRAIASALKASGFRVTIVADADQKAMKRAIMNFGQELTAAGSSTTALFYYAGHGIQSRGTNFLVPVGAAIATEADVDLEAVAADTVLRQMENAGASTNIVILDACRNLPVQRVYRDGTRGLARMEAPNGSYVAYSTAPGSVAADGMGTNSPFAIALTAEMAKPGQSIEAMFRNVRRTVVTVTGGKQTPWDSSSLLDGFVFTP